MSGTLGLLEATENLEKASEVAIVVANSLGLITIEPVLPLYFEKIFFELPVLPEMMLARSLLLDR